jgi:hypothetical protein
MSQLRDALILVAVVFGLLISGCEKSIELEMQNKGGQLVLFSFLTPDSLFKVHLSKSVTHSSVDDFERVYDGNITVYKNDRIVDNFIFPFDESWAIRNDLNIREGDQFVVEAIDGQGQKAIGETMVPMAVPVSLSFKGSEKRDTSTVFITDAGGLQRPMLNCNLHIPDPGEKENFYQLLVFEEVCTILDDDTLCNRSLIDYVKDDPVFYVRDQEESLIGSVDFGGCFSDYLFNGEDYTLRVNLALEYVNAPNTEQSFRKIKFILLSHTQSYFDYYRSRVVAEYGYDIPIIDPIKISNNVTGGLGMVAAYSASSDSLVFYDN